MGDILEFKKKETTTPIFVATAEAQPIKPYDPVEVFCKLMEHAKTTTTDILKHGHRCPEPILILTQSQYEELFHLVRMLCMNKSDE